MTNAACYSGALQFLKAVKEVGVQHKGDGAAIAQRMKATPAVDDAYGTTKIRDDGLALTPSYLFQVKAQGESKYPWDYYKQIVATPAEQAYRPLAEGGCPLVRS
jgi:branched-chain amino acid transport system substrate-binding protein